MGRGEPQGEPDVGGRDVNRGLTREGTACPECGTVETDHRFVLVHADEWATVVAAARLLNDLEPDLRQFGHLAAKFREGAGGGILAALVRLGKG